MSPVVLFQVGLEQGDQFAGVHALLYTLIHIQIRVAGCDLLDQTISPNFSFRITLCIRRLLCYSIGGNSKARGGKSCSKGYFLNLGHSRRRRSFVWTSSGAPACMRATMEYTKHCQLSMRRIMNLSALFSVWWNIWVSDWGIPRRQKKRYGKSFKNYFRTMPI